jgi:hypothetical protein
MNEPDWEAYRRRVRERSSRQMALCFCPMLILVAVWAFFAPTDHPAGDLRDTIVFRLVASGFFIALGVVGFVLSLRWLLADRRK